MKNLVFAAVVASLIVSPASAQAEDGNLLSNLMAREGTSTSTTRSQPVAQPVPVAQSTYRDGPTQSQIAFALQAQREAVRMCRRGNMSDELNRAMVGTGQDLLGAVITRVVNGRRGGYYSGVRNYGYSQSGQDCDQLGQQVYRDALLAQPDSYCDSSMEATYTRGGQPVTEERMVRRCQSRRTDTGWDTSFQPRN